MINFIYFTLFVQNYIYTLQFYAIAFQNISDERELRLIRLREAIEQQRELHAKKNANRRSRREDSNTQYSKTRRTAQVKLIGKQI